MASGEIGREEIRKVDRGLIFWDSVGQNKMSTFYSMCITNLLGSFK